MKKILVMGVGAQGSTIAKRLDEEERVEEIVCADYDKKAAQSLEQSLDKARAVQVDANNSDEIVKAGEGCELVVNGLAPDFNVTVLEAALRLNAHYQDMASGPVADVSFVDAVKRELSYDKKFKENGKTALMNTGSAPGFANVVTREAVEKLDSCHKIEIMVYDGVWSKHFIPFWWSPETAFGDMAAEPILYEDGEFKRCEPFSDPQMIDFHGLGTRRMVNHEHEEPVTLGLLSDSILKGPRYVNFKYGGPALELAEYFYKMGLLSSQPVDVKGTSIVPIDLISALTPPAPKYPEEIRTVIDEGMISEEGAFLVRVEGMLEGSTIRIDSYANVPGLIDSFQKAGITHEAYFTGQAAFLFTKMFVNNVIQKPGVYPPEVLDSQERTFYLTEAAKLDITVDQITEARLY
jgi:saccharopine dehydrogenase-like NADP-dependent oxidoreductase